LGGRGGRGVEDRVQDTPGIIYPCALIGQDEAKLSPDWAEGVKEELRIGCKDTPGIMYPCALIGQDQANCHLIGRKGWKKKLRTG
jgi:hypothetical protein